MNVTKHEVAYAMKAYGGSFSKSLAAAWLVADPDNRARIETTWSEDWQHYVHMARRLKEVDGER